MKNYHSVPVSNIGLEMGQRIEEGFFLIEFKI